MPPRWRGLLELQGVHTQLSSLCLVPPPWLAWFMGCMQQQANWANFNKEGSLKGRGGGGHMREGRMKTAGTDRKQGGSRAPPEQPFLSPLAGHCWLDS